MGQGLDLVEALLVEGQMVMSLEGLRYVLLVVYKMGILLVILGKIHW